MLKGSIKYRDEDFGEVVFDVLAKHSVSTITFHIGLSEEASDALIIGPNNIRDKYMNVVDKGIDAEGKKIRLFKEGCEWEINGEKCTTIPSYERNIVVNTESNKVTTNVGNMELASRLGAIVSYCKQNATLNTSDRDFSDVLSGHLDNKTGERFKDIKVVCDIVYKLSEIVKLDIESPFFSIRLDYADENSLTETFFKPLKQKDKWGRLLSNTPVKIITVKMQESTLGWKIQQVIKKTVSVMGLYQTIEEVIAAHPEKDTSWILSRKYEIVTDEMLESLVNEFMEWDGYIAFDTETTGLKINFLSREGRGDQLVGVILSKKIGTGYYFPLQNKYIKNLCNGDHYYVMEHYLKPILEQKKIITHNGTYDWKVAYIYGIFVNIVYDTMIALGVTKRYEILNFELGLKALAKALLGLDMFDLDDFIIGENEWGDDGEITFADLPYELVRRYGPADGDMTLSLKEYIDVNHIIEDFNAEKVFQLEVQFSKVVAYSEFWGYHIDVERIPELQRKITDEMEMHKKEAYKIAKHEFNMNSPIQLNQVMYEELGIELVDGKKGTDKNILKTLAEKENEDGTPKYPFVQHLKAYRDVESIYKNFLKRLKEFATDDGFIFPDVLFLGTETGRCSVHNPNYQSYNDTVKHYVVPRKDFIMGDSDFGQIEYRTLASMAPEPKLIEAFDDPDLDYHQYQAARMFNVPYAAVTKKLRQQSKGINFGLPYGMGDVSLGARIFGQKSPENTKKAEKLREKFFEGQDNIRAFFDRVRDGGVANGYTETLMGRRRYYHKGKFTEAEIRRQAGNHVIQGCLQGDVHIQTKEYGIAKISNVVGQTLQVWDGDAWTKGTITYSGKKQKCVVHFTNGQTIECSPEHKFAVVSHRGNIRFVPCSELRGKKTEKSRVSAHRVAISQNYCPSDLHYSSKEFYNLKSNANNANNVYLDDINDRFGIGVVLGRLASDGCLTYNAGEIRYYIRQCIAEHEFNILPELQQYMKNLNAITKIKELREDRNECLAEISVFSKTLTTEINALDIRHKIHDAIFADTEMLRGFLRGMFDGDGGVSGQCIALIQGANDDYETLCRDIQKALLFFGIRGRYRNYEGDRDVIQITKADIPRFLEIIGFMNSDKQEKASQIKATFDQHTFGHCLLVDYVEMTDEYVDMYDVCNTERGYFVADGIITHNSAADIYKIAVVRFFNFIVENNLLDKILINAFIHDEILFEVHKSVDMLWFTTKWREAFEVPLENFCKLYAGLGYGKCWYDAKKQDLPTGFITALCELSGNPERVKKDFIFDNVNSETGYVWDDDIEKFIVNVKHWFKNYKFQRVFDYIQAEEEQNKIIKPAIWSLLTECVNDLIPVEIKNRFETDKDFCNKFYNRVKEEVGEQIITFDVLNGDCKIKCKLLDEYIKVYSIYMNIDYTNINILSPDVADKVKEEKKEDLEVKVDEVDALSRSIETAMYQIQINYSPFITNEMYNLVFINGEDNLIVGMLKDKVIRDDNFSNTAETSTCLRLCILVPSEHKHILTNSYIRPKDINDIACDYVIKKGGVYF